MNEKNELVVVAGADGFIGGSLVADLRRQGYSRIRAVGAKPFERWYQHFSEVENVQLDLKDRQNRETAARGAYQIFMLAADMGGMGFIETHRVQCMLSVLISTHMLMAAQKYDVQKYFYSSSACVYNASKQKDFDCPGLKEEDAYPADGRRRLRLGKAFQRAHVPPLPRGFRPAHARAPATTTCTDPDGTWYRRPRESPRRHLPQSD